MNLDQINQNDVSITRLENLNGSIFQIALVSRLVVWKFMFVGRLVDFQRERERERKVRKVEIFDFLFSPVFQQLSPVFSLTEVF